MSRPSVVPVLLAVLTLSWAGAGSAAEPDAGRGGLLYENHCWECHTTGVHYRTQRKARTVADVRSWVARWQAQLELRWSGQEILDVSAYLNGRFYGFTEKRE